MASNNEMTNTEKLLREMPPHKAQYLWKYVRSAEKLRAYYKEINMTPEERKTAIQETTKVLQDSFARLRKLKEGCKHQVGISSSAARASCEICNVAVGWKCNSSPDHICHYETYKDGMVKLLSGQLVAPIHSNAQDDGVENGYCLFCDQLNKDISL